MGLSSKLVSGDGLDWSQTLLRAQTLQLPKPPASRRQQQQQQPNQQQSEPLKCPRCESTNTKFCYYNNYNKSQPRHFCKTCKRHWTKGGTLRNVPVGGGRKSKRQKISKATANATTANTATNTTTAACTAGVNSKILNRVNPSMAFDQAQQQLKQNLPFVPCDQRSMSGTHQALTTTPSSSALPQNSMSSSNLVNKNFSSYSHGIFSYSTNSSATQNQGVQFPCTSSSSFETHPSIFQSLDAYHNNAGQVLENSTASTIMPTSCSALPTQPWQVPSTSSGMDIQSYWNWDDFDTFIPTDLSITPWDDSEIKP